MLVKIEQDTYDTTMFHFDYLPRDQVRWGNYRTLAGVNEIYLVGRNEIVTKWE